MSKWKNEVGAIQPTLEKSVDGGKIYSKLEKVDWSWKDQLKLEIYSWNNSYIAFCGPSIFENVPFCLNSTHFKEKVFFFMRKSSIAYKRNQMASCKKLLTSSPLETVLSQYTNNSILNKRMTISRVYRSETFCCLGGSLGRRTRWETKQRTNKIIPLSIKISHFGKLTSKPPDFNIVSHCLWLTLQKCLICDPLYLGFI